MARYDKIENPDYAKDYGWGSPHPLTQPVIEQPPLTMSDVKDIRLTTTRDLLLELRTRAQNWAGHDGSGMIADHVDDMLEFDRPILNGTREP